MVRTTQNLSETWASRGRCSQIRSPGVRDAIGRNGPRISLGASGFMSNVSSWLGPPNRYNRITFFALPKPLPEVPEGKLAVEDDAEARLASVSPHRPRPPVASSSLRVRPLHSRLGEPRMRRPTDIAASH